MRLELSGGRVFCCCTCFYQWMRRGEGSAGGGENARMQGKHSVLVRRRAAQDIVGVWRGCSVRESLPTVHWCRRSGEVLRLDVDFLEDFRTEENIHYGSDGINEKKFSQCLVWFM